ncbi:MAG: potassium transporter Kup [Gemmatimonadota bacterium]|nr:potassium transporter Kup [Gemmatimonadota bacterium]
MNAEPSRTPPPPDKDSGAFATSTGFRAAAPDRPHVDPTPTGRKLTWLSLTALGVVFGNIGTSPLYAMKQCFNRANGGGMEPTPANVFGILSLIVWSLTLIVSVKYIVFIMRADNQGEGGILSLLALLQQRLKRTADSHLYGILVALGLFGAALLYGDGVITPAVSVLSAIEGLHIAAPSVSNFVVPIAVVILFGLFMFQRFGTDRVGRVFGPVMFLWFGTISILGVREIVREPAILKALNPWYGVRFFLDNGMPSFVILGAVVLAVTGAEALYADMGHFGRRPIRLAWFALVFPALLMNYFGQGALLLRDQSAAANPFYLLVPPVLLYPMLILATVAAVIASQALISGAFSLTQQAMQLGYCPRVTLVHTSKHEAGQIYVPEVNKALMVFCIILVIGFESSDNLAAAYGIAVTGTMVITTLLFYVIARQRWQWSLTKALSFLIVFLTIDIAFLAANAIKIEHGGWVPLLIAVFIYTAMTSWKRGRELLSAVLEASGLPIDLFIADVTRRKPPRVPGTAVFMSKDARGAPVVLLHHLKHNKVLHEQVLLLSVQTERIPEVPNSRRANVEPLGEGIYRVSAYYGFMQTPNVREIMACCEAEGIKTRANDTTYYLGRERLIPVSRGKAEPGETPRPRMARWRKKLFIFMSRNARSATEYFGIPPNRVVELGAQIEF